MEHQDQHIIPRDLSLEKIKKFLFPDLEEIDPHLQNIFARQAGTSLFLISALVFAISVFIFGISLVSNIPILVLTRSTIVLVVGMLIILALHKILKGEHRDMKLLVAAVIFIASWGVAKDIANFDVLFNSYGILYIVVLFIGMIQMPFKPRASLFLGLYCAVLYVVLWFLLVRPVLGINWLDKVFGDSLSEFIQSWIRSMPENSKGPFSHFRFYSTWYVLQYPILGIIALVFRAANLHAHLKTFLADKTLATKEAELSATKAFLLKPESQHLEFKSSLRWDYHTGKINKKLEEVVIKTIAAFMNAEGGILFIGVDDDGKPLGLENDYDTLRKKDTDGLEIFLYRMISDYLGVEFSENVTIAFPNIQNVEICSVTVQPNDKPVFVKRLDGAFFVRTGNQTQHLNAQETMEYIAKHFE